MNDWCSQIHDNAEKKGFWDVEDSGVADKLMLIVTEVAEACEADRVGDFDNFKEEIADIVIRVFDLCGAMNIDIEYEIEKKHAANLERPKRHGKRY